MAINGPRDIVPADATALAHAVEHLIDLHGVAEVLNAVAQVCSEKAEHLRANWQDTRSAKAWDKASVRVSNLVATATIGDVSP